MRSGEAKGCIVENLQRRVVETAINFSARRQALQRQRVFQFLGASGVVVGLLLKMSVLPCLAWRDKNRMPRYCRRSGGGRDELSDRVNAPLINSVGRRDRRERGGPLWVGRAGLGLRAGGLVGSEAALLGGDR